MLPQVRDHLILILRRNGMAEDDKIKIGIRRFTSLPRLGETQCGDDLVPQLPKDQLPCPK